MLLRTKNEYAVYEPLIKNFKMKRIMLITYYNPINLFNQSMTITETYKKIIFFRNLYLKGIEHSQ